MNGYIRFGALAVITAALLTIFAFAVIIPNVRFAKQTYAESTASNVYLPYVRYDELPYQPEMTRGLSGNPETKVFDDAMLCYQRKDYSGAVRGLNTAVKLAPGHAQAWLYLGVSHFLKRQSKPALEALTQAERLGHDELKIQARWYLAQTYLLTAKPQQALPLLAWISTQNTAYASDADSLQHRLQLTAAR
jgi:hypothetical protein